MEFPCEVVGRTFLPAFRSSLAKELVEKYGFSQVDVARRLGITQAAVSQYMHAKRAKRTLERRALMRVVEKMARSVAKQIWQNKISSEDMMRVTCELCAEVRAKVDHSSFQERIGFESHFCT